LITAWRSTARSCTADDVASNLCFAAFRDFFDRSHCCSLEERLRATDSTACAAVIPAGSARAASDEASEGQEAAAAAESGKVPADAATGGHGCIDAFNGDRDGSGGGGCGRGGGGGGGGGGDYQEPAGA